MQPFLSVYVRSVSCHSILEKVKPIFYLNYLFVVQLYMRLYKFNPSNKPERLNFADFLLDIKRIHISSLQQHSMFYALYFLVAMTALK